MAAAQPHYDTIGEAVARAGLRLRGGFRCAPRDAVPGAGATASLVLVGSVGADGFDAFRASPEYAAAHAHPLDRFSERAIDALAAELGARPLYPHRGPPWLPFQRWAMRAEGVHPSPLGLLIHPEHGLWHAYRGALLFDHAIRGLPAPARAAAPCAGCVDRPCLAACPVGAFGAAGYDVAACTAHLASARGAPSACADEGGPVRVAGPAGRRGADGERAGTYARRVPAAGTGSCAALAPSTGHASAAPCMDGGCLARRACPVAPGLRYRGEQAAFHMAAFRRAQTG